MTKDCHNVWDRCLRIIKQNVSPQSYRTWFEPIRPVGLDDVILTIQVPNKFFYEWLEEHYVQLLKQSIRQELGERGRLVYRIPENGQPESVSPAPGARAGAKPSAGRDNEPVPGVFDAEMIKNPFVIPGIRRVKVEPQLNPQYTFDNYIEGDCNRLARNAGLAIAGGTSQYAIQNIAEGAQVGTKQYQAGLEKLEEAAKERRRQAAAIEEARRAEARGDWKEANLFREKAAEAEVNLEKSKIDAVAKMTGEDIATAAGIVNNQNQISARDRQVEYQGGVELLKQRMSDISAEKRTARMAAAYGGNKDPINIATDNAAKEFDSWLKSSAGKLAGLDQSKIDAAKRQIFNDVFRRSGLPIPYPAAGGVNAPAPSGGRFVGFETQ